MEVFAGGSVAGLDGHALVKGDVKPGNCSGVGFCGEVAFVDPAFEAGLKEFDDVLTRAADDFSEVGQILAAN